LNFLRARIAAIDLSQVDIDKMGGNGYG